MYRDTGTLCGNSQGTSVWPGLQELNEKIRATFDREDLNSKLGGIGTSQMFGGTVGMAETLALQSAIFGSDGEDTTVNNARHCHANDHV